DARAALLRDEETVGAVAPPSPHCQDIFHVCIIGIRGPRLQMCRPSGRHPSGVSVPARRTTPRTGDRRVAYEAVGSKVRLTEFMQNGSPGGVCGAWSNTCPRCEPHLAQRTSVRTMPRLRSEMSSTRSPASG